jgi:pSer/pThr/pTyr-binding forkhead associated (FHA) protein
VPQLKVVITKNLVETVSLAGPPGLLIGRGETADIPLLDAAVSREHCWIEPDADHWVLRDLSSANGSFVNDSRVEGIVPLTDGDVIRLGSKVVVFTADEVLAITGASLDWREGTPHPAAITAALDSDVVSFKFPSNEQAIEDGLETIRNIVSRGPLAAGEAETLVTATREAVTNGMMHGNGGDLRLEVRLRVAVDADKVRCTIEDEGEGFDYRQALDAGRTRHAMDLARERYESGGVGGLGIMLILRSVDLVEYNAAGNRVALTKWRGDFYRDQTVFGSLGLFSEVADLVPPVGLPDRVGPPAGPKHQTVQFESGDYTGVRHIGGDGSNDSDGSDPQGDAADPAEE